VLHSPKVPHPDFSVKVIGHNLKILLLWKTFEAEEFPEVGQKNWGTSRLSPYFPRISRPRISPSGISVSVFFPHFSYSFVGYLASHGYRTCFDFREIDRLGLFFIVSS
jgi:hypothetical protein